MHLSTTTRIDGTTFLAADNTRQSTEVAARSCIGKFQQTTHCVRQIKYCMRLKFARLKKDSPEFHRVSAIERNTGRASAIMTDINICYCPQFLQQTQ
jgi:hypothetical protein